MDRKKEGGYSLMEVGLALSIGILLTGSAVYAYRALRDQSGDAAMRQKVQDLQVLIEELNAPRFALPDNATLQAAWKLRRPQDYDSNPWGGKIPRPTSLLDSTAGIATQAELLKDQEPRLTMAAGNDDYLPGGLYYYRIENKADGTPGAVDFGDMTSGALVTAKGYAVAGNKIAKGMGQKYFHVQGGR